MHVIAVRERPPATLALLAVLFLLPVATSTALLAPAWSLRAALLLAVTPLGLAYVPVALRQHRAAWPALALATIATVATILSPSPASAFFGQYGLGTGLVFVLGLLSVWTLAATRGHGFERELASVLLAGAIVNAAVAVLQATTPLSRLGLGLFDQRSAALLGNPVQLSALLAGGAGLVEHRFRARPRAWAPAVLLLGTGLQVSGSRFVLLFGAPALAILVVARRDLTALVFTFLLGLGFAIPLLAPGFDTLSGTTRLASEAEGVGGSSTAARIEGWRAGGEAVLDRPLLGHGPGRYLEAVTPHRSLELARIGPDSYFADAHNVVIEFAVGTGIVGALLLVAWLGMSVIIGRRSPLVLFALGVLAMQLVQPLAPSTTPLAVAALGAALTTGATASLRRILAIPTAALLLVATAFAAVLVASDYQLRLAQLDQDADLAEAAVRRLPHWYNPTSAATRLLVFDATVRRTGSERFESETIQRSVALAERLAEARPADPRGWNLLGSLQFQVDQVGRAEASFARAEELAPWSRQALDGLQRSRRQLDDAAGVAAAARRLAELEENG